MKRHKKSNTRHNDLNVSLTPQAFGFCSDCHFVLSRVDFKNLIGPAGRVNPRYENGTRMSRNWMI